MLLSGVGEVLEVVHDVVPTAGSLMDEDPQKGKAPVVDSALTILPPGDCFRGDLEQLREIYSSKAQHAAHELEARPVSRASGEFGGDRQLERFKGLLGDKAFGAVLAELCLGPGGELLASNDALEFDGAGLEVSLSTSGAWVAHRYLHWPQ